MKVISVENISKKFILAHDRPKNLADASRAIFKRTPRDDFWALKDVSFEVEQGEALGIIGPNGAGKSTMLKLLTKIMKPTTGRIRTKGRISALIEVGAGFHPEMTGRENVYLNGAILGMKKVEIDRKFDQIVEFAELEKFIDTPVKRYSSGMYARLGFSVAAHVDPEILIVDEVLSVGDSSFQERCNQRMQSLLETDTTIVFVSHNMAAVTSLCSRAIVLWQGNVDSILPSSDAVKRYSQLAIETAINNVAVGPAPGQRTDEFSPISIKALECLNTENWLVAPGGNLDLRVQYYASSLVVNPRIGLLFRNAGGLIVARTNIGDFGLSREVCGDGHIDVRIQHFPLLPGSYSVHAYVADALGSLMLDEMIEGQNLSVAHTNEAVMAVESGERTGFVWLDTQWQWPS